MSLDDSLAADLEAMEKAGTLKTFRHITGPMDAQVTMVEKAGPVLVLSSNNYLGLSDHPERDRRGPGRARGIRRRHRIGALHLRHVLDPQADREGAWRSLSRTEAALTYVSCWTANTGLIPAVAGEGDALVSDELNHASLIDGCRASKARRLVYKHADMADLDAKLDSVKGARRIFVVTDGVFSMEGDIAPLGDIVEIAKKHGASVILDDSHGTGRDGQARPRHGGALRCRGPDRHHHRHARQGARRGRGRLRRGLSHVGRIPVADLAAAALLQRAARDDRGERDEGGGDPGARARARRAPACDHEVLREGLKARGFKPLEGESAIVPIIVGDTAFAIRMSKELLSEGIFITGFGYPVVPEGTARLRIQACASLTDAQIAFALASFEKVGKRLGVI